MYHHGSVFFVVWPTRNKGREGHMDDAMVAIIANYPGLLPASQVNETGVQPLKMISFYALHLPYTNGVL